MNIGIDIGSREVKIYGVTGDKRPKITEKVNTVLFYQQFGKSEKGQFFIDYEYLESRFKQRGKKISVSATGYGRENLKIDQVAVVSEIQAHANGAIIQTGQLDFTLLDIGGQDIKVVAVKDGTIEDFLMNDKCAAGTGRYLEQVANTLGVTVEKFGTYKDDPLPLSHTCAIFGETEIVTKVAQGHSIDRLCAGANLSVARRILPLIKKFPAKTLIITGGGAKNQAVVNFIEQEIDAEILIPKNPQFNGAIGCCLP